MLGKRLVFIFMLLVSTFLGGVDSYAVPVVSQKLVEDLIKKTDGLTLQRVLNGLYDAIGWDRSASYLKEDINKYALNMTEELYEQFEEVITEHSRGKNEGVFHIVNDTVFALVAAGALVITSRLAYCQLKTAYLKGFDQEEESFSYENNNASRSVKWGAWLFGVSGSVERDAMIQQLVIQRALSQSINKNIIETSF